MVKVERSTPAPESLAVEKTKADGKYDKPDVVERLKKILIISVIFARLMTCRIHKLNI